MIPIGAVHQDSRYYYDPMRFNPSRFEPEEVKKRPNFSFLPFGDGPRNVRLEMILFHDNYLIFNCIFPQCIGMRFGQVQTKLGIATMIKNFQFEFHEGNSYPFFIDNGSMLLSPYHPIKALVRRIPTE